MNKNTKKIYSYLLCVLISILLVILLFYIYVNYLTPDKIRSFEKYDGLSFDYRLEEDNYKDKMHYLQLNDEEAKYYRAIYHSAINGINEYEFNFLFNSNDEYRARVAFELDYPEYYWACANGTVETKSIKDKLGLIDYYYSVNVSNCYDFSYDDIAKYSRLIKDKTEELVPQLKGEDDIVTTYNIYKYLIDNVEYDMDYLEYGDIRAALLYGKAVCASYSETFQYLCNQLGIECYSVEGKSTFVDNLDHNQSDNIIYDLDNINDIDDRSRSHEWNIVKLNDRWYWVDVTWADDQYIDKYNNLVDFDNDVFFLSNDELFNRTHEINSTFTYPSCDDDRLILLFGKGIYLKEYDEFVIESAIKEALENGRDNFIIELKDKNDIDYLIDWLNSHSFFDVYQNTISYYYEGTFSYFLCDANSYYLFWHVINY